MPSSYKDANPNAGASAGGGMKNDDGREKGEGGAVSMNPKHTFDPNEDAPRLGQIPGSLED